MKTFCRAAAPRLATLALLLSALPSQAADAPGRELEGALRAIVDAGPLASARAGIVVQDVESGQVLYAKDPDALLNGRATRRS